MREIVPSVRTRHVLLAWIVVFTGASGYAVRSTRDLATQGREARQAICALRADLQGRIAASERFLHEHPKGIPGVPVSVIRDGIANQRKTVEALSGLDCTPSS